MMASTSKLQARSTRVSLARATRRTMTRTRAVAADIPLPATGEKIKIGINVRFFYFRLVLLAFSPLRVSHVCLKLIFFSNNFLFYFLYETSRASAALDASSCARRLSVMTSRLWLSTTPSLMLSTWYVQINKKINNKRQEQH